MDQWHPRESQNYKVGKRTLLIRVLLQETIYSCKCFSKFITSSKCPALIFFCHDVFVVLKYILLLYQKLLENHLETQCMHTQASYYRARVYSTKSSHFPDHNLKTQCSPCEFSPWQQIIPSAQLVSKMHSIASHGKHLLLSILIRRGRTDRNDM